jgi:hypothetical protein
LVSAPILETITDQTNPIHEKSYSEQVKELGLLYQPSTLQYHINKAGAKRFKKVYTSEISPQNLQKCVAYGNKHRAITLTGFWEYV